MVEGQVWDVIRTNAEDKIDALDFSINTEMSADLNNFNPEKILEQILSYLRENLNVITLAACVIGEKTLNVLNNEKHITRIFIMK